MEQATRNDIAAAAAAHRELGSDFDGAVAESLVDRIGTEIDRRIDARLGSPRSAPRSTAISPRRGMNQSMWTGIGVGTGITGIVAMIANRSNYGTAVDAAVVVIWIVLAIVALGTALVHRQYRRERE